MASRAEPRARVLRISRSGIKRGRLKIAEFLGTRGLATIGGYPRHAVVSFYPLTSSILASSAADADGVYVVSIPAPGGETVWYHDGLGLNINGQLSQTNDAALLTPLRE
jgi:hypothetical protein